MVLFAFVFAAAWAALAAAFPPAWYDDARLLPVRMLVFAFAPPVCNSADANRAVASSATPRARRISVRVSTSFASTAAAR